MKIHKLFIESWLLCPQHIVNRLQHHFCSVLDPATAAVVAAVIATVAAPSLAPPVAFITAATFAKAAIAPAATARKATVSLASIFLLRETVIASEAVAAGA
eukprot:c6866_g1_i1 orf=104-406(+)